MPLSSQKRMRSYTSSRSLSFSQFYPVSAYSETLATHEVGLRVEEQVQVVLLRVLVPFPGGTG